MHVNQPIHTGSSFFWRRLVPVCLALLALTQAAQAAPATKASLRAYFEATGMERQISTSLQAIAQAQQDEWQAESDPERQAAQKEAMDDFNARMRTRMVWSKVEPVALASYQAHLSESDVKDLLAHARTPAGQVRYHKLNLAMIKQLPVVQKYLLSVISQLVARPAPAEPAAALPPAGPDQPLLLTYLRSIPGEKEAFEESMAAMEDLISPSLDASAAAAGETALSRSMDELKAQLSFDKVTLLKARLLSGVLSDAELALLIEDNRRPQRAGQMAKLRKAEQQFQQRLMNSM